MLNPLILVVDDSPDELELTRRAVERRFGADYEVAASLSCKAGLELLSARAGDADSVALVLADLSMPEMSGIELLSSAGPLAHGAKRLLTVTWGELDASREPILRAVARPTHDRLIEEQIAGAIARSGAGDLADVLNGGETWTVE